MLIKRSDYFDGLSRIEQNLWNWLDASRPLGWQPAIDIHENEKEIVLEAELPGINMEDVKITVESGILTIKGEKKYKKEENKYFRAERVHGSFLRSFSLPSSIDLEKISASYEDGVLTVKVPKKPENIPRQIEVKIKNRLTS